MFVNLTFIGAKGEKIDEIKACINTDDIAMITEHPDRNDACFIKFKSDIPSGIIKGTYEDLSKLLTRQQNRKFDNYRKPQKEN